MSVSRQSCIRLPGYFFVFHIVISATLQEGFRCFFAGENDAVRHLAAGFICNNIFNKNKTVSNLWNRTLRM
jgi:hypothetical protein